ncbi:hypothetical protein [Plantibacter sp. YIM 135249]|uniref:hypothetical protein n=1 Tax=Plantibacter sp. YIM 135249 TaxID=3423918 RepID=UPI003D3309A2
MTDPTPTELIAEARAKAVRVPGVVTIQEALADALEAQLAETARLQAVIDAARAWATDAAGEYLDHAEARELKGILASAGSSSALEAVKADTEFEYAVKSAGFIYPSFDLGHAERFVAFGEGREILRRTPAGPWVPIETEGETRG